MNDAFRRRFADLFGALGVDGEAPIERAPLAIVAPDDWRPWLAALFPQHVGAPFAQRHVDFWEHVWAISINSAPRPFVGVWSRGGGKSTTAELATAALGLRGARRYAVYVRETQEQADKSVANIAALLESAGVELYYPTHGSRAVSKFGESRGWRRNRLRTAGGFTIDALGLDTHGRGVKIEEQRPDLLVFDDLDGKLDSPATTDKKIQTLTTSILPMGSNRVAVIAIQNLIIPDGIFSRLADGRADFLADRMVSGPYPAVEGLETALVEDPVSGASRAMIVAGRAAWAGQDLEACQRMMDTIGLGAFKKECQHDVFGRAEGLVLRFELSPKHMADRTLEELRRLVKLGSVFGGLDFGLWRFAFVLFAADEAGVVYRVAEVFSQRESLSTRARKVHEACVELAISGRFPIWGDAANPTDILELNAAFKRGWEDEQGNHVSSTLRVAPVAGENKIRITSVDRWNDLLDRRAFRLVRSVGGRDRWLLGYNAANPGVEQQGSRLLWELQHWKFPLPKAGEAQRQDPDDHTADGADEIAASRYALMSWWRPGRDKEAEEQERHAFDPEVLREEAERSRTLKHRLGRKRAQPIDDHFGGS